MSQFPIVYATINKNLEIREKSSSGGIFYLLANYIISQKGVVFGAKYDSNWEVIHDYAEDIKSCMQFMGSKYVQSKIGNNYKKVEEFLKQGRMVLFSGTPCQVYGLKAYLNKEYDNLLTIDFICHGVPSRLVWRNYIAMRANNKQIRSISFRDKTEGWLAFSLKMDFEDGSSYRKKLNEDLYMKGFLQDIYLRPSCYECRFKSVKRDSDITIADLWGCKEIVPELFDDRGTSLILIQSKNGYDIWNAISAEMRFTQLETEEYQKYNSSIKRSVNKTEKREVFYRKMNFKNLNKLTTTPIHRRVLRQSKRIVKKLIKR